MRSSQQAPYSSAIFRDFSAAWFRSPRASIKGEGFGIVMGVVKKLAEAKLQKEAEEEKKREN